MAMTMTGSVTLPADRETVWAALNDPEVLKRCIPGCQELDRTGDDGFAATAKVSIGPVKATFKGNVKLSDIDPPNGYTISGRGAGRRRGLRQGRRQGAASPMPRAAARAQLRRRGAGRRQDRPARRPPHQRRRQEIRRRVLRELRQGLGGRLAGCCSGGADRGLSGAPFHRWLDGRQRT